MAYEVVGSPIPLKSKVKVAMFASTPYIVALSLIIENVSCDGMSAVKFTRPKLKELSSNFLDEIVCGLIVIFGLTKD